jgi:hypothetical protein
MERDLNPQISSKENLKKHNKDTQIYSKTKPTKLIKTQI